ncbi:type IV toxin-antitoxin system AbiEi family antitoxin domain-containing protein [Pedococcus sp. 2YAF34]|uniref:type IV toxin-antitoxin system AbiEi family antitoxin domain-containing protein n=1 Tax=Pedococcus sp. 2YAF34 TaxID=3233032 RepID=UPI003F9AE9CB
MATDWHRLRVLADQQRDLLTRRQCLAAGMSAHAVEWRVTSGRWVAVQHGVYLTRPGRDDWVTRATAALLRCSSGDVVADAALRGRSAAFLWGLVAVAPPAVEVVVPQRRQVRTGPGIRVRRSMRWDDLVDERAWPWRTTVAATVLDVGTSGSAIDAVALAARAVQKELVSAAELRRELRARGGHRHSAVMGLALADVAAGAQSGAELLYLRDVERAHGLPRSVSQSPSDLGRRRWHDHEYTAYRLVVEVDGRLGHEQWSDRVRDGRRDRLLLGQGRTTTRVFWNDVAVTPCQTAHDIAAILGARGWSGTARPCRRHGCAVGVGPWAARGRPVGGPSPGL